MNEDINGLKNQEKREIVIGSDTKVFKYIEPSFEKASLVFSRLQDISMEITSEADKSQTQYSEEEISAKVFVKFQADENCKKAMMECLKYSTLNDLPFDEAMKLSENWKFANSCNMLVIKTIVNNFMGF